MVAVAHEKVGHTGQGLWHHKGMQLPAVHPARRERPNPVGASGVDGRAHGGRAYPGLGARRARG